MVTYVPWGSRIFDENTLGTIIQIKEPPKQFQMRKIIVTIRGLLNVLAGGAADYQAEKMMFERLLKNLQFTLGSGNLLKNIKGYQSWYMTQVLYPNNSTFIGVADNAMLATGNSYEFLVSYVIPFEDVNTIMSDNTLLIPSKYEDIMLELEFNNITDITSAGDRPITITQGYMSVMIEQEKDVSRTPKDELREWSENIPFTVAGDLNIDLNRTDWIERMHFWTIADAHPDLLINHAANIVLDKQAGASTIMEGSLMGFIAIGAYDMSTVAVNGIPAVLPINMNPDHDLQKIFDGRTVSDWRAIIPVMLSGGTDAIELHYYGRRKAK